MRREIGLVVAILALLLLLGGAGCAAQEESIAPAFSLRGADGQQVALEQLLHEHEVVVLVFYRDVF